jgi:hypothetical protein
MGTPTNFVVPTRLIKDVHDLRTFETSPAATRLQSFIQVFDRPSLLFGAVVKKLSTPPSFVARNTLQALNASVCGVKLSDECVISPLVTRLLAALSTVEQWTDDYPPSPQQMRYGNVSFRTWHQRLIASTAGACTTRPAPLSGATHTLPGDRSCLPLVREGVALTTRAILARRSYGASVAGGQSCETEHSLFHVFYFRLFSIPLKDERVECRDTFALSQLTLARGSRH